MESKLVFLHKLWCMTEMLYNDLVSMQIKIEEEGIPEKYSYDYYFYLKKFIEDTSVQLTQKGNEIDSIENGEEE